MTYRVLGSITIMLFVCGIAPAQQPQLHETLLHAKADVTLSFYQPVKELSGELTSTGSETMAELMKLWFEGFTRFYPNLRFSLEAKGIMTAMPALIDGRVQIATVSRDLMPPERERFIQKFGYEPTPVRVALGSYRIANKTIPLAFYVHKSNPIRKLNFSQLEAMYCTTRKRGYKGEIVTWGQLGLGGEWASRPIVLVGVLQPDSYSKAYELRQILCEGGEFTNEIHAEKVGGDDSVLDRTVSFVAQNPAAIGYGGFANRKPNTKRIAISETERGPYLTGKFPEVASG